MCCCGGCNPGEYNEFPVAAASVALASKSLTNCASIELLDRTPGSTECEDLGELVKLCSEDIDVAVPCGRGLSPYPDPVYALARLRSDLLGPGSESTVANEMTDILPTD